MLDYEILDQPLSPPIGQSAACLKASHNLGTFATSEMDKEAAKRFIDYLPMNGVDWCAYPELSQMHQNCGAFLLKLFHANPFNDYAYFSTSGSSESIFLAVLLYRLRHPHANRASFKPNLLLSDQSHMAWQKAGFCLGIELRYFSSQAFSEEHWKTLEALIDENTIAFCTTLGTTSSLTFEPVEKVNRFLEQLYNRTNHFVPIHVDAASGGFVVPFVYPHIQWDFKLKHVKGINVSSHKYGGVYPSLGWLCFHRDLPHEQLSHQHHYLGQTQTRYPIQFSHSAGPLAAQDYLIKHYQEAGYVEKTHELYEVREQLKTKLQQFKWLHFPLSEPSLPGIILSAKEEKLKYFSAYLKNHGWHLPIYTLPPFDYPVARILIRHGVKTDDLEKRIQNIL